MKTRQLINLKNLFKAISNADKSGMSDPLEYLEASRGNRRTFLKQSAILGVASALPSCTFFDKKTAPKIAIIGAGIAGLNAAWILKQAGIKADIYEAGYRIGGRIFTTENLLGEGLTTEMGAEFIDSNHAEMWRLIKQFNLPVIDLKNDQKTIRETYFFGGKHHSEKDLLEALKPFAKRLQNDVEAIEKSKKTFEQFDNMPLDKYIESLGLTGWLKDLFVASFTSEYGRDLHEQSSLNLLTVFSSDFSHNQFSMYGESDERFKIKGGNSMIIKVLEKELKPNIQTGKELVRVSKNNNNSYSLTFLAEKNTIINADIVIFTLPFTKLRSVDLTKAGLPNDKMYAIQNYQLGTNGKVFLGFDSPVWRKQNELSFTGNAFTEQFICGWDNSLLQEKTSAGYTIYYGGKEANVIGKLDDADLKNRFLTEMDIVFAGSKAAFNDKVFRYHWQENNLSLGSYTCFAPRHYTQILPHTQTTIEQLYFAGEHCSEQFQGFMNGGAQSGRDAAEAILKKINKIS
jgi:monoamine oxidase